MSEALKGERVGELARHRLTRNLASLSVAAAVCKVLSLATSLIVSRVLGPTIFGTLAVAQTFVVGASLFGDLGLTVVSMRDIVHFPEQLSRIVTATAVLQCVSAIILTAVIFLLAIFAPFPKGSAPLLVIASPMLLATALSLVYALQGVEDMALVAVTRLLGVGVSSIGSIVLVIVSHSPRWLAAMSWVGFITADIFAIACLRKRHGLGLIRVRVTECVALLRTAVPFIQNGALAIVLMVVDTASLSFFGSAREVGIYSIAWTLSFGAAAVLVLVTDASFPEMVRRWQQSPERLCQLSDRLIGLVSRLTFAGASLVATEVPGIIRLLLGPSYDESAKVLTVLIWIVPVGGISLIQSFAILASGAQKTLVRLRLVTVVLAVAGCSAAAYYGGVTTVAATILGAFIIETLLFTLANSKLGSASALRPWITQLDYLVGPLVALTVLNLCWSTRPLIVSFGVWSVTTVAIEGRRRFSTVRSLIGARGLSSTASSVVTEPPGSPCPPDG